MSQHEQHTEDNCQIREHRLGVLEQVVFHDHEPRMRSIEKTIWQAFGASAAIQILIFTALEFFKK